MKADNASGTLCPPIPIPTRFWRCGGPYFVYGDMRCWYDSEHNPWRVYWHANNTRHITQEWFCIDVAAPPINLRRIILLVQDAKRIKIPRTFFNEQILLLFIDPQMNIFRINLLCAVPSLVTVSFHISAGRIQRPPSP